MIPIPATWLVSTWYATLLILGIGQGFLTISVYWFPKIWDSTHCQILLWDYEWRWGHCEYGCHLITLINTSWSISFMRVALWTFEIGYGLLWNGFAPSFNWMETEDRFHSPRVPSNNCSNLRKSESSDSHSDGFRCLQLSLAMAGRSALAYLACVLAAKARVML